MNFQKLVYILRRVFLGLYQIRIMIAIHWNEYLVNIFLELEGYRLHLSLETDLYNRLLHYNS